MDVDAGLASRCDVMIGVTHLHGYSDVPPEMSFLSPDVQEVVWFLGALVTVRTHGMATGGRFALLEHHGERGYGSPVHSHRHDEETFFVLDGELRVQVGEKTTAAGPGSVAFLPRQSPHGFVVTSPQARFLTFHTPAGFEEFALAVGTPAVTHDPSAVTAALDPVELTRVAADFGIDIVGPPLLP